MILPVRSILGYSWHKQGCRTSVTTRYPPDFFTDPGAYTGSGSGYTEQAFLPPEEAYIRTYRWFEAAKDLAGYCFIKKTDSTMRGNIGAELQAAISGSGRKKLLFVPALPQLGRTTRQGVVYIDGIPLEQTPFASDPFTPVCSSSLREIILHTAPEPRCRDKTGTPAGGLSQRGRKSVLAVDAADITQLQEIALTSYRVPRAGGFLPAAPVLRRCFRACGMLRLHRAGLRARTAVSSCVEASTRLLLSRFNMLSGWEFRRFCCSRIRYLDEAYWQSAEGQLFYHSWSNARSMKNV